MNVHLFTGDQIFASFRTYKKKVEGASLQLQGMQLIKKSLYGAKINWTTYSQKQAKLKSGKVKLDLFTGSFEKYMDSLQ